MMSIRTMEPDRGGAPGEFRHPDPLIKSQLLCL